MPKLRQSVVDFGRDLIESRDLDPVYVLLWECKRLLEGDRKRLNAWLLAYWAFYHMGTASWITEGLEGGEDAYWNRFRRASASKQYKRCTERRHFRGQKCIEATGWLGDKGLDRLFAPLSKDQSFKRFTSSIESWPMFGPWISFKAADMYNCLDLHSIEIQPSQALYEGPMKGIRLHASLEGVDVDGEDLGSWGLDCLDSLTSLKQPPNYQHPVGLYEKETVYCKWYKYWNRKYRIGEDTKEQYECLSSKENPTPTATLNGELLQAGEGVLWSTKSGSYRPIRYTTDEI